MQEYVFPSARLLPPTQLPADRVPALIVTCGSYNPIHTAHIASFSAARSAIEHDARHGRDVVVCGGLLSPVNDGYAKPGLAPFVHRLALCRLALQDHPWLDVDPWEGLQDGFVRSYFVLQHIRDAAAKLYGRDVRVYFLCGADLFETFYRPGCWRLDLLQRIFTEFHLCVVRRVGAQDPREVIAAGVEPITNEKDEPGVAVDLRRFLEKIIVTEIEPNELSSTRIRNTLRAGESVEGLVPAACASYLLANDLYRE